LLPNLQFLYCLHNFVYFCQPASSGSQDNLRAWLSRVDLRVHFTLRCAHITHAEVLIFPIE
jgi:hypothetical protein